MTLDSCLADLDRRLDEEGETAYRSQWNRFLRRADHYISSMANMEGLTAVNVAQPELNDMEIIDRNTVDRGLKILALQNEVAGRAARPLRGQVQCYPSGLCDK